MEKTIWVVSINNDIKGYVNSFQEGLDYIKNSNWFDRLNTWEDWWYGWDKETRELYPTFNSLYNMHEKDILNFWYLFDGALDIFEIDKLIVEEG